MFSYFKFSMLKKLFIVILFLLFITVSACNNDNQTPEQHIRFVINEIEAGIENRSLSKVIDHISEDYHDHKSRTKKDIQRYVQLHILRNQSITILSKVQSIDIEGDLASVELSAAAVARGANDNDALTVKADTHKASLVFKQKSGNWKVISASWDDFIL